MCLIDYFNTVFFPSYQQYSNQARVQLWRKRFLVLRYILISNYEIAFCKNTLKFHVVLRVARKFKLDAKPMQNTKYMRKKIIIANCYFLQFKLHVAQDIDKVYKVKLWPTIFRKNMKSQIKIIKYFNYFETLHGESIWYYQTMYGVFYKHA
jgi:hypothetical protein